MTQSDLAEKAGVSKTTQANYESNARPADTTYLRLAAAVGVDVLYVITGTRLRAVQESELVPVKRLNVRASAGPGVLAEPENECSVGELSVNAAWLARRRLTSANLRAIQVRGSSMQGALSDGDLAIVDTGDTAPRDGFIYVIRKSDELIVKYCQPVRDGVLRISSANPAFPAYDIDLSKVGREDVRIIGRVVASMHDW